MESFKKLNNIIGWSVFAIASFVYLSTIEQTLWLEQHLSHVQLSSIQNFQFKNNTITIIKKRKTYIISFKIILSPIIKTNQPKPFLSLLPSINLLKYNPVKIPIMDKKVNPPNNNQSMIILLF
jgi:hypothetical protein